MKACLSFTRTKNLDCAPYACAMRFLVIRVSCWLKEYMIAYLMLLCKNLWKTPKRFFPFPFSFLFSSLRTCGLVSLNLTRPHSSTWGTKGFKELAVNTKCNHHTYEKWFPHVLLEDEQNLSLVVFFDSQLGKVLTFITLDFRSKLPLN